MLLRLFVKYYDKEVHKNQYQKCLVLCDCFVLLVVCTN